MTLKQIRAYLNIQVAVFTLLAALSLPLFSAVSVAAAEPKDDHDLPCGVEVAVIKCPEAGTSTDSSNGILSLLILALQIMTTGVGIVAVGGFIYGGILYASAADRSDQVKKSIEVIRNVIIGVVAYGVMFALLNFLIPGGVFR